LLSDEKGLGGSTRGRGASSNKAAQRREEWRKAPKAQGAAACRAFPRDKLKKGSHLLSKALLACSKLKKHNGLGAALAPKRSRIALQAARKRPPPLRQHRPALQLRALGCHCASRSGAMGGGPLGCKGALSQASNWESWSSCLTSLVSNLLRLFSASSAQACAASFALLLGLACQASHCSLALMSRVNDAAF